MKRKAPSMNLIIVLAMTALIVGALAGAVAIFLRTYRAALIRNAETTSRQVIAQVSGTMERFLQDTNDSMKLLSGYLDLLPAQRESRFHAFLEINRDVVAITTYDERGQMMNCYSPGYRLRRLPLQNLSFDPARLEDYAGGYISAPHVMSIFQDEYPWVVTLIEPVSTREGECWVAMDIGCSNISSYISGVGIGNRGYCFLEDTEGQLVYHPQQQLIYSSLKTENTAHIASLPDGTYVEGSTIYTVQTLSGGSWRVVGVSSVQELITDGVQELRQLTVLSALLILTAAMLVSVLLSCVLSRPIQNLISAMRGFEADADHFSYEPVRGVREVQALSVSFEHMVKMIQKLMETARNEEISLRRTELKALQAQVNPHFLYNTLDSILWMCEQGHNADAALMVNALAQLFRISISRGHELIPIRSEVQHARSYLQIQSVRYRDQFTYSFDVEERCLDFLCNKITLQPLIENAINHGLNGLSDDERIDIRVFESGEDILFTVTDNGVGMEPEQLEDIFRRGPDSKSGIGVTNVNERLRIWFGERYGVSITSVPDEGTCVTVRMPKIRQEAEYEDH